MNQGQLEGLNDKIFANMALYYADKSLNERYSIFMGKSQILELGLKKLLISFPNFDLNERELEKLTLGQTRVELEKLGLRADYNFILQDFVRDRNEIVHNFFINYAITQSLIKGRLTNSFERQLDHACFALERLIILFDFFNTAQNINVWLV